MLHLLRDLVGTFCDDADGFVDVSGFTRHFYGVASDGVCWSVAFFVVHVLYLVFNVFACNFENVVGFLAVFAVGVVGDE